MVIPSDMEEHLFSNLDGYAQKIPPDRDVDRGFYFADEERLSEYELKTVEEMPPSLVQSLSNPPDVKISNEERDLRACVCGAREPRAIAEQAIVKLVLQALILGGLTETAKTITQPSESLDKRWRAGWATLMSELVDLEKKLQVLGKGHHQSRDA